MNYESALLFYIEKNQKAKKIIARLQEWNPEFTKIQNAKNLNLSKECARIFAFKYGLSFIKIPATRAPAPTVAKIETLLQMGFSIGRIATIYHVKKSIIQSLLTFPLDLK